MANNSHFPHQSRFSLKSDLATVYAKVADGWADLNAPAEGLIELDTIGEVFPQISDDPIILKALFRCASETQDHKRAAVACNKLIKIEPTDSSHWINRSTCYRETGRVGLAFQSLQPAIDIFPEDPAVAYNMARLACVQDQNDYALELLAGATKKESDSALLAKALKEPDLEPIRDKIQSLAS